MIRFVDPAQAQSLSEFFGDSKNQIFNGAAGSKNLGTVLLFVDFVITKTLDLVTWVGFIMVLYSAYLYFTAYGEESKAENAKKTLIWSIVGLIVVGLAKLIVGIINRELS